MDSNREFSQKRYLGVFFLTAMALLVLSFVYVTYSDPYKILDMPWTKNCSNQRNDVLKKFQLIEAFGDADALIAGASTAEAYATEDIEKFFGAKAFNASVAGADTLTRLVLIKKALQTFKSLKYVFYTSDLYEYNNARTYTKTYYQKKLRALVPDWVGSEVRPSLKSRIWDVFSYTAFENATASLKTCLKGNETEYYLPDGMTTRSMVISDADKLITTDPGYDAQLDQAFSKMINLHIGSTLQNFERLSPVVKALMKDIVEEIRKRDVKLIIIMSPYHPKFHAIIDKNKIGQRRAEWGEFIHSLSGTNSLVFDYEDQKLFPSSGNFWKDGHHYKREAAYMILKDISNKTK